MVERTTKAAGKASSLDSLYLWVYVKAEMTARHLWMDCSRAD